MAAIKPNLIDLSLSGLLISWPLYLDPALASAPHPSPSPATAPASAPASTSTPALRLGYKNGTISQLWQIEIFSGLISN